MSKKDFVIPNSGKPTYINRTFTVDKNIHERLDKLSEDNCQYRKKIIVNHLLNVALDMYGY